MKRESRRLGVQEVQKGPFKGALHISTKRFNRFFSELLLLDLHLNGRVLPIEPEEKSIMNILVNLQNILEHLIERAIIKYTHDHPSKRNRDFQKKIIDDYVTFKTKYEWTKKRKIISPEQYYRLDELRDLRNKSVHIRPKIKRLKLKYSGYPLLTQKSLRKLFSDMEMIRIHFCNFLSLRSLKDSWPLIPIGYAEELNW